MHEPAKASAENVWRETARGNRSLEIRWTWHDCGLRVSGNAVFQQPYFAFDFELGLEAPYERICVRAFGKQDLMVNEITLSIERGVDEATQQRCVKLMCNLPLREAEFFNGHIGEYFTGPAPMPDDPDGPDDDIEIDPPHGAADLFPFVWLHPLRPAELLDIAIRFMRPPDLSQLPLYQTLVQAKTPKEKADAALAFISGPDFVDFSTMPEPMRSFAVLRTVFEAPTEFTPLLELTAEAERLIEESLDQFVESADWIASRATLWQSLFALALAGTPDNGKVAQRVIDTLRSAHYLVLLQKGDPAIEDPHKRRIALNAIAALPDAVAAVSPTPALSGPQPPVEAGRWEVLGVGTLKHARQRLAGYAPGEVAEVVNVMPNERQEVQERRLTAIENTDHSGAERVKTDDEVKQRTAANELSDAIREVMSADGILRNVYNMQPSYQNLDTIISGSWGGGGGGLAWEGQGAARFAQQMTEQAVHRLSERVSTQRQAAWRELHERRQSTLIDNAGKSRLVGIYRWVDRVMKVHVHDAGRRLVLSFLLADPAQPWIAAIAAQGPVPLIKPEPLPIFAVPGGQGFAQITSSNYQAFGATYGIADLEPPPPATLALSGSFDRVDITENTSLHVPAGYVVASGQVTVALSDNRYNLLCVVAGQTIATPAPSPVAPAALSVTVPVPSGTSAPAVTNPGLAVPAPPMSAISVTPLAASTVGLTGPVPVTVMSAAPSFAVRVDLVCQRAASGEGDEGMIAWQMRTYDCLYHAWQTASRSYAAALAMRVADASAGHSGEVQRDALKQICLQLLLPANCTSVDVRKIDAMLDWPSMTWRYEPWSVGQATGWPEQVAAVHTQSASERLFRQFLLSPSAQALVPVAPGQAAAMLFWLQFNQPWVGSDGTVPVTDSSVALLEEIEGPGKTEPPASWTLRLPTSMLYLQEESGLPSFQRPPEPVQQKQGEQP